MNKGDHLDDLIEKYDNNNRNLDIEGKWNDYKSKNRTLEGNLVSQYPQLNYENGAHFANSYPQHKSGNLIYPKCRFEQFWKSRLISEIVNEYRKMAKKQPDYFMNENSLLLIYWKEDKVWYYWSVLGYNQAEDKFNLKYDDGVQETVKLWNEIFITHNEYLKIKSKLEPPREKYEKAPVGKNEFSSNYWYQNQNSQQPIMMETKKKGTKRGKVKDTKDEEIGKIEEKVIIGEFLIIWREYNASESNSSLSGDELMGEDVVIGDDRVTSMKQMETGRNYIDNQVEMKDSQYY